jgi:hypothetical protein
MSACWRAWVALLAERERGTSLALFRIAVGAVVAGTLLATVLPGLVEVIWIDRRYGGMRDVGHGYWLLELLGGAQPAVVWPLVLAALGCSVALALGAGGRATPLLTLWLYRSVSSIGGVAGGYDSMIFNALWLLVLGDASATLSLDCRLRSGRWQSRRRVAAWPRYLVIFQLVVIYAFTGVQKASASWTPADGYSAVYWFLQDPNWIRFDHGWAASVYPATQIITAGVWFFEVLAPLLLLSFYFRRTATRPGRVRALFARIHGRLDPRVPFTVFGVGMHLGIALLLNMGPFSWISISYYLCLWRPAELERLLRRSAVTAEDGAARPALPAARSHR